MDQNFQVNLEGVISLLSDHLYSGPEVYVRELLQNAVDAITARRMVEADHPGRIRVEILSAGEGELPTLSVEDDGVGLTEEEVHEFLATIGQSSKKGELTRDDFIGQFGIGLLSGFVVSDEVTVITQSLRSGNPAIEWKGRSDGTYSVRRLDSELSPGTRVYLRAKADKTEFFQPERVEFLLRHFGHHLPYTTEMLIGGEACAINERPPWEKTYTDARQEKRELLDYGRQAFEIDFLDAIPLRSDEGSVEGVAFVLPFATSAVSKQAHRVYLKSMLLAEDVDGLLPPWAFFVRCVVNAKALRPNAAREAFHEDATLSEARKNLGESLKTYLIELAKTDRERLDAIIHLHYLPIKSLATEDEEFFRLFIDWLPFESSLGTTTLDDHFRASPVLQYVPSLDQFRQISSVANAQKICVFNGGYTYDTELFERLAFLFPGRRIERIEVTDLVQDFDDLTLAEQEEVFDLVKLADVVLQPYKCSASARKFQPAELPTLYTANDQASFMRAIEQAKDESDSMWEGILDSVAETPQRDAYSSLVLNYRNPLIPRLAALEDRELLKRIIELLYLQSLLMGHYPLRSAELDILGDGMLGLINHFIEVNTNPKGGDDV